MAGRFIGVEGQVVECVLVVPQTWQSVYDLFRWKKRKAQDPTVPSPLEKTRMLWPDAPLEYEADSGQAFCCWRNWRPWTPSGASTGG